MINEYLLKEKKINIDKMMEFCEDGIVCSVKDLKDDIFHIVSYCSEGETYEDAIKLSKINEELKHRKPIVLLNEASDYFIKELFPLVNRFERLLRKTLYLYDALLGNKKNISRLEEKGLGEVFNMIMTDPVFDNKIKGFVNETRRFTKRQLIKEINTIQEENQCA
ncbi:MAG: hypothetical protein IJT96_04750 [Lachnospiraceae bacterium]|nr:hypothetical protein [Lachnospiraceae bacterium]